MWFYYFHTQLKESALLNFGNFQPKFIVLQKFNLPKTIRDYKRVLFLFSQLSAIKIIVYNKKFLGPIEDNECLKWNLKSYFNSDRNILGVWKLSIWPNLIALWRFYLYSWIGNEREFFHASRIIPLKKIVSIQIEASKSVMIILYDLNFCTWSLILSKNYIFSKISFPKKTIRFGLRGSRNFQSFVLQYQKSW